MFNTKNQPLILHWPEYLMEAAGLGIFMISAGVFTILFEYPGSPVYQILPGSFIRRALIGLAMGLTAILLIYSPWGKQSGAHFNPAVTLTFYRLKKVTLTDTLFYMLFQLVGGTIGVFLISTLFQQLFTSEPVSYVVTRPGSTGIWAAFIAEVLISFILMISILFMTNRKEIAKYTGVGAGILLFLFITFEAPYSGMSINPARTFASAFPSHIWTAFWVYLTAPVIGMFLAAEIYAKFRKKEGVICAKLNHHNHNRCIFLNCGYELHESNSMKN